MEPDAGLVFPRPPNSQPVARFGRIGLERLQQGVERAGAGRRECEPVVQVAANLDVEQAGATFHQPAHVGGKELQVALSLHVRSQVLAGHLLFRHAVDLGVALADPPNPGSAERFFYPLNSQPLALGGHGVGHEPGQRLALEQAADDIEHIVGGQFVANLLELLQKHLQHPALARAARYQVDDPDFELLAVAMDPAHPLFQAGRVPRNVVVDHQAAELQIDALARGVGGHHVARAVRTAKGLHLAVAFLPVHAAMDLRCLPPVAEPLQAPHQVVHRVPVLTEDEPLLVLVLGPLQHLSQALELRLPPGVDQSARPLRQRLDLPGLAPQLLHTDHSDRAEHRVLVGLVSLGPAV